MSNKNSIAAIPMASFDAVGLGAAFSVIDAVGFDEPILLLRINNACSSPIIVSYDGIIDHDYVDADAYMQISFNSADGDDLLQFKKGTRVYVRGAAQSTGLVYLTGYYRQ
jgi:hypothetical protein